MSKRLVYLAGPIDQVNDDLAMGLRAKRASIIIALEKMNFDVYDPYAAFKVGKDTPDVGFGSHIMAINHAALDASCAIVAVIPKGVPTIGTPMEVERSRSIMPTFVVTNVEVSGALAVPGVRLFEWQCDYDVLAAAVHDAVVAAGERDNSLAVLPVSLKGAFARLPEQAHRGDAGFDLYTSVTTWVEPGEYADVPTGVHIQLPDTHWGFLIGRSSTLRNRGLMVNQAVIDSGYRGELFAGVKNLGDKPVQISIGERVAQFIPMGGISADVMYPVEVAELENHERGTKGFGSTGK